MAGHWWKASLAVLASGCTLFVDHDGLSVRGADGVLDGGFDASPDAGSPGIEAGPPTVDAGPVDPAASSLIGYWSFDEGTGTTASDGSGRSHHAVLRNQPTWIGDGRRGGALSFEGSAGQYVQVLSLARKAFPSTGTLSLWVRSEFAATPSSPPIFDTWATDRDHFFIRQDADKEGKVQFAAQFADGGGPPALYVDVSRSTWVQLAMTWRSESPAAFTVYVDGVLAGSRSLPAGWKPEDQLFEIARPGCCQALAGDVDEVRLYNRVLAPHEIASIP